MEGEKKDEGLVVKWIYGDTKRYQTMWANVKMGDDERRMNIGVVPGLLREMLLGRDWVGQRAIETLKDGLQGDCKRAEDELDFFAGRVARTNENVAAR